MPNVQILIQNFGILWDRSHRWDRDRGIGHIRTTQTNLERTEEPAEVAAVALNSKLNFQLSTGHILAAPVCISISRSTTVI